MRTYKFLTTPIVATLALCLAEPMRAQDPSVRSDQPPPLPEYIQQIEMREAEREEPIAPVGRALYNYADAARVVTEGAIWAWGEGRPTAMAKCWKNRNGSQTCAFSLTSDKLVVAQGPQRKIWQPQETQTEPAELPGAPVPNAKDSLRLLQLKEQARRFTAHEFWDPENSRFQLRLMNQPVHRYRDDKLKIIDGAVFLLAIDNNPQILLLLEIVEPAEGKTRWQYSLARVSSADLHVLLDDKEVWSRKRTPGVIGRPTDVYWHMVTLP